MEQQCHVAEVSRAGFYRYLHQTAPKRADLLLRGSLAGVSGGASSSFVATAC